MALAIVAMVALALTAALGFIAGRGSHGAAPAGATREELAKTPDVVLAIRGLARLETVAYHMERIIDLKNRTPRLFGLLEVDDAIVLVAVGEVVAGVDLAKLRDGDVTVIEAPNATPRVRVRLPAPEVLSAHLDNQRTYVQSRKTDMLAEHADQMETRARQLAEQSIRDAALEAGILEHARRSAEQELTTLVRALGYESVTFEAAVRE
jgi:hypothetical protein